MKKLPFLLLVILFIGCTEENPIKNESGKILSKADLDNIGAAHNLLLENVMSDSRLEKLTNRLANSRVMTSMDSLELMKTIQQINIENHSSVLLTVQDEVIDNTTYNFSDEELLSLARLNTSFEVNSSTHRLYIEKILNAYTLDLETRNQQLSVIYDEINNDLLSIDEKNQLLAFAKVLEYSTDYWDNSSKYGKISGWLSIGLADASGAYAGAVWGSIAGPAGTVIMGVNGALLNSAFTAAVDLVDGQIGRIKEEKDDFDVQGYLNSLKIKND